MSIRFYSAYLSLKCDVTTITTKSITRLRESAIDQEKAGQSVIR